MYYNTYGMGFILLGTIICLLASWNVKATFKKYAKTWSRENCNAENMAELILSNAGITDVRIERISGELTDHYDPTNKVLRLSDSVYGSSSMASIGVAAHECGHAIQHHEGYAPIKIRSALVPVANIGSTLSIPIILLGIALSFSGMVNFGIILFCAIILFQLVTLPVEFDASNRACRILDASGRFLPDEMGAVKKVLTAAALTYVAALLNSILQLLRLIGMSKNNSRRR